MASQTEAELRKRIAELESEVHRLKASHGTAMPISDIPMSVMTDSYKATHFLMYPDATKMVAYGEFRTHFNKIKEESRFLFFGMRYIVETYLHRQWTEEDVVKAEKFYSTHNAGFTPFPFPKDLFLKFIRENKGYFPVKLEALPEGTCAHIHTPVYQLTAEEPYTFLCTYLETLLTQIWYPTCVATLSRMAKDHVERAFDLSVDDEDRWLSESRLHDFGFRGCTSAEQSVLGGTAHLLNFTGSDTMSACYYAQFAWNHGKPVATSIPATEHSVMTAWPTEQMAIENMIAKFGSGVFATVMDSYNYQKALDVVVPAVSKQVEQKAGLWVLRPDSGDPVEAVISGLEAAERAFGARKNKKGFKVLHHTAVIQGDGINVDTLKAILDAALAKGYSAQNCAFGMGGGLLQKVNRDTMGFATKLSHIRYADGREVDIMKLPATDSGKISLPGILRVRRSAQENKGLEVVVPRAVDDNSYDSSDLLRVVYNHGPVPNAFDDFATVRERSQREWRAAPKLHDPIGPQLKRKVDEWKEAHRKILA